MRWQNTRRICETMVMRVATKRLLDAIAAQIKQKNRKKANRISRQLDAVLVPLLSDARKPYVARADAPVELEDVLLGPTNFDPTGFGQLAQSGRRLQQHLCLEGDQALRTDAYRTDLVRQIVRCEEVGAFHYGFKDSGELLSLVRAQNLQIAPAELRWQVASAVRRIYARQENHQLVAEIDAWYHEGLVLQPEPVVDVTPVRPEYRATSIFHFFDSPRQRKLMAELETGKKASAWSELWAYAVTKELVKRMAFRLQGQMDIILAR